MANPTLAQFHYNSTTSREKDITVTPPHEDAGVTLDTYTWTNTADDCAAADPMWYLPWSISRPGTIYRVWLKFFTCPDADGWDITVNRIPEGSTTPAAICTKYDFDSSTQSDNTWYAATLTSATTTVAKGDQFTITVADAASGANEARFGIMVEVAPDTQYVHYRYKT